MPIWYCLVSSNTSFRSTDKLCEAARAWQNIYLLVRWNLCVETDNLPSNLHHLSFTQSSYPSTNIDKFILTSAKNRNVPFEHNIFCIVRFRGGQVNSRRSRSNKRSCHGIIFSDQRKSLRKITSQS